MVRNLIITNDVWHQITIAWNNGENRYDIYYDGVMQDVYKLDASGHVGLMTSENVDIGTPDALILEIPGSKLGGFMVIADGCPDGHFPNGA